LNGAGEGPGEGGMELVGLIGKIAAGKDLTADESEAAFTRVMAGEASPVEMAGLLVGLRTKGASPGEVAGGVRALRGAMIPVAYPEPDRLVDTCGTGGGSVTTFNVSTAAALVTAAAGFPVAKHGNRSFTSRSGSADVLEALGVRIDLTPGAMSRVLQEVGIVFMFAPLLHPAMRHVGPVRRELKIPTIMNLLGPLTNPAGARRQVVGVADPVYLHLVAGALRELGHLRALVVHGEPGMDEVSPLGPTRMVVLEEGELTEVVVTPEELGVARASAAEVAGGSPEENAELILRILKGEVRDGALSLVLLNAAAAIQAAGGADTLREGMAVAEDALGSGRALRTLDALRESARS